MRSVADGGLPAKDDDFTVVLPPDERSVGVLAFPGHNVVCAEISADWVRARLPEGDLAAPLQPPFLSGLASVTGRCPDNLDMVLVAPATGRPNGMELTELTDFAAPHPRLARALAQRIGVRAWHCPGGLLTLGRGVAGRWEVSIEVEPALRGFGLGRGLFTAARGLLPAGETVWAQVAPGNAASVRAALAAGFRPVGAEVLLRVDKITVEPFTWFEAPEQEQQPAPEQQPEQEPELVIDVDGVDDMDGRDDPDELVEQPRAGEILDQDDLREGDSERPDGPDERPLSVSDNPTVEDEKIDSDEDQATPAGEDG